MYDVRCTMLDVIAPARLKPFSRGFQDFDILGFDLSVCQISKFPNSKISKFLYALCFMEALKSLLLFLGMLIDCQA